MINLMMDIVNTRKGDQIRIYQLCVVNEQIAQFNESTLLYKVKNPLLWRFIVKRGKNVPKSVFSAIRRSLKPLQVLFTKIPHIGM